MKKIFAVIVLAFIAFVGVKFGLGSTHATVPNNIEQKVVGQNSTENTEPTSPTRTQIDTYGIPTKLLIPKISVDAVVEPVGLDAKKAMDVPKGADNAGWYNLGVKPGEKGNAVLDGHLDKASGAPAVFWNVTKLIAGDKIVVGDKDGKSHSFAVIKVVKYPYDNFPLQQVFGPTDKHMLNLISCNGVWNSKTHNYSQRTVVYSELVQ